ncbi:PQ loop repeat-domain-containing protein [Halteromyces radiatus]|uniref:PQ loop repeat-domain-containing protein n=1 Tax=Halteromyces radiatus TaxID=101107 RepID=UPI00221E6480|nr:PQ loop repeat-domain-containing protein [Halteromyces radiatus]KAI8093494.1 PQ loop repeat-domain-containing protein [Halteromyces radiatus]
MNAWDLLSELLGWSYFIAWSFSSYPQLYLNWQRKSVRGLSLDYLCYSILGFLSYTVFTLAFYFNQEIQDEYYKRHNSENLVQFNDVAFAIHGLTMSLLLLYQTYIFKGNKRHLSSITAMVTWLTCMGGLLLWFAVHYGNSEWIHLMYYLSFVKLGSDALKFLPQIWLNYKRKSTLGWSVHLILLDTLGGICSIIQLVVDAYIAKDWSGISGDLAQEEETLLIGDQQYHRRYGI